MIYLLYITKKRFIFKGVEAWFSDSPFDINDVDFAFFRSCNNETCMDGFIREEFTTHIINLEQENALIWKNFSKSSCKYAINRALRDGVKIRINRDYDQFININHSFRKRKSLINQYISKDYLIKNGTLLLAYYDNELLAGQFYISDQKNFRWLIGASKRLESDPKTATIIGNANRLLVWEAIKLAKNNGIKEFDLGGYYSGISANPELERINRFKRSFGGTLGKKYNYTKIYSKKYKIASNLIHVSHLFYRLY